MQWRDCAVVFAGDGGKRQNLSDATMCGIAGFIDYSRAVERDHLDRIAKGMADRIKHRGPDDGGTWVDSEAGIAFGHRRLSIIDLSNEGHQPMHSTCARYVTAYNGEIYNFRELRRELEGLGHKFRGHSDTEVMLAAITEWGMEQAIPRFNGMFAFAVWDRKDRLLHLVRDRLGEKPLYYGWMDGAFLFGSELKALRAHPRFQGEIDRNVLALYLRHNYIPAPYSIFRNIYKLPPAAWLTLSLNGNDAGRPSPKYYWSVEQAAEHGVANPVSGSEEETVDELDRLLRDAVSMRMVADVPLGAFLSGGVDSSAIVALMQSQSQRPIKTFTIGFNEEEYNEATHAKAVAQHLGTEHTELYVTPKQTLAVIPKLPTLYDEPFSDSSQIPTFLISELTRRHVTVSLSGDAGDELFGGYNRYFLGSKIWSKVGWAPEFSRRIAAGTLTSLSPSTWSQIFKVAGPVLPAPLKVANPGDKIHKLAEVLRADRPETFYHGLVSHWKDPASLVPGAKEPATALTELADRPVLADFRQRMQYLDTVTYLPDDILVKVDRAAMGVSLETRVPFLDHRVVEYAWRIPLHMKYRNGGGKWILKQVLNKYVPKELVERPKMGFGVPIDSWLRGPLRDWAESLLDERRLKNDGFFNPAPIRKKWNEHLGGNRNWQYHLWDILMFQAWHERC